MESTALQLAKRVSSIDESEIKVVHDSILHFDTIVPTFSSRMLELFAEMGDDMHNSRIILRSNLNSIDQRDAHFKKYETPEDGIIALMHLSVTAFFIGTVRSLDPSLGNPLLFYCKEADSVVKEEKPELVPDINDSFESLRRYHLPLVASTQVPSGAGNTLRDEAPSFVAWAGKADDVELAVTCALKAKTLNVGHLQSLLSFRSETSASLHEGVI